MIERRFLPNAPGALSTPPQPYTDAASAHLYQAHNVSIVGILRQRFNCLADQGVLRMI
jgi:hypothetical protein